MEDLLHHLNVHGVVYFGAAFLQIIPIAIIRALKDHWETKARFEGFESGFEAGVEEVKRSGQANAEAILTLHKNQRERLKQLNRSWKAP